jgi:AP-3 complex subunit beta
LPLLETLLKSATYITIGATLEAVDAICPDNLGLLHPYFRRICQLLIDSDEWSQSIMLALLLRYARRFLSQPDKDLKLATERQILSQETHDSAALDPDLALLLQCTLPLLQSRNASVVLAAVRTYYLCGPPQFLGDLGQQSIVTPLLRLSHGARETQEVESNCWEILRAIAEERSVNIEHRC